MDHDLTGGDGSLAGFGDRLRQSLGTDDIVPDDMLTLLATLDQPDAPVATEIQADWHEPD